MTAAAAEECPTPKKERYRSRRQAARVRRLLGRKTTRPYRCVCGFWHLGRLARDVVQGKKTRDVYRNPKGGAS